MNCSSVDVKAYALGEAPPDAACAAHIESCESCREELERLRLTRDALLTLPEEEIPRRIAFVSDKIFEPRWWQRIWQSGPVMAFASACVLAVAILAHDYARPAAQPPQAALVSASVEQQIQAEVEKRVDARIASAVNKATAESEARLAKATTMLETAQEQFEAQRRSDLAMMQQTATYYENKVGRLMVATNANYGSGQ